jgi:predicted RNase H-like nuclease
MGSVAGVDGWRAGWIVAVRHTDGPVRWHLCAGAADVLRVTEASAAVAVDVPMGLPDTGRRLADQLARAAVPGRAPSVFPTPVRAVLDAGTHADAIARARSLGTPAPSAQAWNLTPGIRDWDAALTPALQRRVVEVHPEVVFARLAGQRLAGKRTARGVGQRLAALASWVDVPAALAAVPDGPAIDDALDALACTWTAARWAAGEAEVLPPDPPTDPTGLLMRIVV